MTAPYRLVTALAWCDDARATASWRPDGGELGVAGEAGRPPLVPGVLVLEALAQCAGLLLGRAGAAGGAWLLSGVEGARFGALGWGEDVELECAVARRSGRAATIDATATGAAGGACGARILMVRVDLEGSCPKPDSR